LFHKNSSVSKTTSSRDDNAPVDNPFSDYRAFDDNNNNCEPEPEDDDHCDDNDDKDENNEELNKYVFGFIRRDNQQVKLVQKWLLMIQLFHQLQQLIHQLRLQLKQLKPQ
jgi:hypothetical protein